MTTQATAPIGTVVAKRQAGSVEIRISTALGGYTVTTWCGVEQVAGWCGGYPTHAEARDAANHARDTFKAHGTVEGINRRRQQLITDRDRFDRLRMPARVAACDTELDALDDLHTRAALPAFVDHLTATLAA